MIGICEGGLRVQSATDAGLPSSSSSSSTLAGDFYTLASAASGAAGCSKVDLDRYAAQRGVQFGSTCDMCMVRRWLCAISQPFMQGCGWTAHLLSSILMVRVSRKLWPLALTATCCQNADGGWATATWVTHNAFILEAVVLHL
jgi:hypothetical protein